MNINTVNNVLPTMRCKTQTQGSTAAHGRGYSRSPQSKKIKNRINNGNRDKNLANN